MSRSLLPTVVGLALALLLSIGTALAGRVTVDVTQQAQGVENADVTVTNLSTGAKTSGQTGKGGQPGGGTGKKDFDLAPGVYKVTVSKDGKSATTYILVTDKDQTVWFNYGGFPTTGSTFTSQLNRVRKVTSAGLRAKHNRSPRGQDEADDELEKHQGVNGKAGDIISGIIFTLEDRLPAWVKAKLERRRGRGQTVLEAIDGTISSVEKKIKEADEVLNNPGARQFMSATALQNLQQERDANQAALDSLKALRQLYPLRDQHRAIEQAAETGRTNLAKRDSAANRDATYYSDDDDDDDEEYRYITCFVAGTLILMADGSTKNIEDVVVGERVIGRGGAINTVTGLDRPRLGTRLLYAFDGGRPFVTAEHPFLTKDGWKSIDPRATRAENPGLTVGKLQPGDRVVLAPRGVSDFAGGGNLAFVSYGRDDPPAFEIGTITATRADPDTPLYNLLLDGNDTYFADGYLVHNKEGNGGSGGNGGNGGSGGSGGSGGD